MKYVKLCLRGLVLMACVGQLHPYTQDMPIAEATMEAIAAADTEEQATRIHHAAATGDTDLVRNLLNEGANVNARDANDDTPLHKALEGRLDKRVTAHFLLENGADARAINKFGNTPLHYANSASLAQVLLKGGADVNAQNKAGITPLHMAVVRGKMLLAKALLNARAKVNLSDNSSVTPLHLATAISYLKNDDALKGAIDPSKSQPFAKKTLAAATIASSSAVIVLGALAPLIHRLWWAVKYAKELPGLRRRIWQTLSKQEQASFVLKELKRIQDPWAARTPTARGKIVYEDIEAFKSWVKKGHYRELGKPKRRILFKKIATISAIIITILAATIVAVDIGIRNEILNLLLKHGANPNAQDSDGNTPLHTLADGKLLRPGNRRGGFLMAKHLILRGANPLIKNNGGQVSYDLAKENKRFTLYGTLRPGAVKKRQVRKEKWQEFKGKFA